jgi:WD40 repeat protein
MSFDPKSVTAVPLYYSNEVLQKQLQTQPSSSTSSSTSSSSSTGQTKSEIDLLIEQTAKLKLAESMLGQSSLSKLQHQKQSDDKKEEKKDFKQALPKENESVGCAKFKIVKNVHADDIHTLLKISDQHFVSGSKDGSLRMWDMTGKLVKDVYQPKQTNYEEWITSLGILSKDAWVSGTRNGCVDVWKQDGSSLGDFYSYAPEETQLSQSCKARNSNRVLCLAHIAASNHVLVGWPTQFTVHDADSGEMLRYCISSKTDWVYGLHALSPTSLLSITGPDLDHWTRDSVQSVVWKKGTSLIKEERNPKAKVSRQRLFISAMTPLASNQSHFGLSVFDGYVRVFDVQAQKTVWDAQEHQARVWTIENITNNLFASCADDGYIKLWDARQQKKSVISVKDNDKIASRVSVLLKTGDFQFLSGSCPDDVFKVKDKAQFSFWDIRKGSK